MGLKGFSQRWKDFPDYIIGITGKIWEDRGVDTLNHYYAPDIPLRSPMGIQPGNQAVISSTMATMNEFPDRELFGEDVIWSKDETGCLSSHRLLTTGTHGNDGAFGKASGKSFNVYVIADCAAKVDTIFDEWLVRDYGGIVRGFENIGADYGMIMAIPGGGDAGGGVMWMPQVIEDAAAHGLVLGENGKLCDTRKHSAEPSITGEAAMCHIVSTNDPAGLTLKLN